MMERYRCEFCRKLIPAGEHYTSNDQGTVRYFCSGIHAGRFYVEKYCIPLPGVRDTPSANRGVTNDGRMQDIGVKAGETNG